MQDGTPSEMLTDNNSDDEILNQEDTEDDPAAKDMKARVFQRDPVGGQHGLGKARRRRVLYGGCGAGCGRGI